MNTTYKPWPSCRWTQYPLTAFFKLKQELGLQADEIDRILAKANPFAQSARFKQQQPDNQISAEFSHAHALAMGAFGVPPGPLWYDEDALKSPKYQAFRSRVTVELEPRAANLAQWMENGQFRRIPGGVEVHARGKVHTASVDMAAGDPWSKDTLFTDEALRQKFIGMVCGTNPGSVERRKKAECIIELVDKLENIKDLAELCDNLGTDSQR